MDNVGIIGIGTYFPPTIETAADLAPRTDIPEHILREKMGINQRHIAGEDDSITQMASNAAQNAIQQAGIDPTEIDLVISHGSQHKDHLVWNSGSKIQHNIGATNAYSFEMYALCAGAPIALNMAKSMMLGDPSLETVVLAAASKENELINFNNVRSRFMFNFGSGGGAMILRRGATKNLVLGASAFTDGSLSETVILTEEAIPEGEAEVIGEVKGRLDVTDPEFMANRLGETTMDNFIKVMREALEKSNATFEDVAFLGITHMKKSFYLQILDTIGLTPEQSVYLDNYGHIQSVDQAIAIQLGLEQAKIKDGDLVLLAGAGTGYTWSASVIQWGDVS